MMAGGRNTEVLRRQLDVYQALNRKHLWFPNLLVQVLGRSSLTFENEEEGN